MAKRTREELSKVINDLEIDDDVKISLMEDLADSMEDVSDEIDKLKEELADLTERYKSRFLESTDEVKEEVKEELEEKEVIDIKEI